MSEQMLFLMELTNEASEKQHQLFCAYLDEADLDKRVSRRAEYREAKAAYQQALMTEEQFRKKFF